MRKSPRKYNGAQGDEKFREKPEAKIQGVDLRARPYSAKRPIDEKKLNKGLSSERNEINNRKLMKAEFGSFGHTVLALDSSTQEGVWNFYVAKESR